LLLRFTAPPAIRTERDVKPVPSIRCPHCDSEDTELLSLFGQQLLTVQYYCNACRTPFERVKGRDVLTDAVRHVEREGREE
jgi:DNA-directed RNA polymerase subunit RPC12/RpoP